MEDKRIEEIKEMMYKAVQNYGYALQVEAAKAYAMLCMVQQKDNKSEITTTHNHTDNPRTGWFVEIQEG